MDVVGKTEFKVWDKENNEHQISFEWRLFKRRFDELLMEYANVDFNNITENDLIAEVKNTVWADDEIKT